MSSAWMICLENLRCVYAWSRHECELSNYAWAVSSDKFTWRHRCELSNYAWAVSSDKYGVDSFWRTL